MYILLITIGQYVTMGGLQPVMCLISNVIIKSLDRGQSLGNILYFPINTQYSALQMIRK